MKDVKNKITTVCAIIVAVCSAITISGGIGEFLPDWALALSASLAAAAVGVSLVFIGRRADGKKKSPEQIAQNTGIQKPG